MKKTILSLAIALTLTLGGGAALLSGCANLDFARQVAEQTHNEMADAMAALESATRRAKTIYDEYQAAVDSGDIEKANALKDALVKAQADINLATEAYQKTEAAYKKAADELGKAESAEQYIWGVLGLLGGAIGGFFTGRKKN